MSSDSALPLVTFGKYKGKPVTEMLADTKYVEWCKQQEFFKKHTTIYNICVNQTIGSQQPSKTPEHNRIQNLFLDDKKVATFMASLKTNDEGHINHIVEQIGKKHVSVEFEGKFNWDVVIESILVRSYMCTKKRHHRWYHCKEIGKSLCSHYYNKCDPSECKNGGYDSVTCTDYGQCLCTEYMRNCYIEVKPLVGDDYPSILRKMNTQKGITDKIVATSTHGTPLNNTQYVLLVKDYQSTTTTKEELVKIFGQSGIRVVFLYDIFPDLPSSSPPISSDEKTEVMAIQMNAPIPVPVSSSVISPPSSSDERIDMLEKRIARLEALLAKMGVHDEE